ncbi:MAG: site-specific integrase [Mediterranea sp.]|jgi:integrase|nr:site-specific integrase [Mediterranea sp.]
MKKVFLIQFMEGLIEELVRVQRDGTAHVYRSTLNRLRGFMKGEDMTFHQLTSEWLMRFERELLADQLTWNTISTYMRTLRSVYNQAVECDAAPYVPRLFSKIYTGVESKVKRAVRPETMRKLMMENPALDSKQVFSRDIFVLLFLFRGMSFVDLAYLRRCDLQGNVITYRRHKTGRQLTIAVEKEAMEIIRRNENADPESPFLFPIIKRPGRREYKQYSNMLRSLNYRLLQVAHTLKLKERISTYTARHTWATTAIRQNFNPSLICDAMGHSSVKVTETYFKSFREEDINRMNRKIVSFIRSSDD